MHNIRLKEILVIPLYSKTGTSDLNNEKLKSINCGNPDSVLFVYYRMRDTCWSVCVIVTMM